MRPPRPSYASNPVTLATAGLLGDADRLSRHLLSSIDAACEVRRLDGTGTPRTFLGHGWLAVGSAYFALVRRRTWTGQPCGGPLRVLAYRDVRHIELALLAKATRAELILENGDALRLEAARAPSDHRNAEVVELLVRRCDAAASRRTEG